MSTFSEMTKLARISVRGGYNLATAMTNAREFMPRVEAEASYNGPTRLERGNVITRPGDLTANYVATLADRYAYEVAVRFVEELRGRARQCLDVRVGSIGRVSNGSGYAPGRYEVTRIDWDAVVTLFTRFGPLTPTESVIVGIKALSAKSASAAAYAEQRIITAKRIIPQGLEEPGESFPMEYVDGELMERRGDGELYPVELTGPRPMKYDTVRPGIPLGAFSRWEANTADLFDGWLQDSTLNALCRGIAVSDNYGQLCLVADRLHEVGCIPVETFYRNCGANISKVAEHVRKLGTRPKFTKPLRERWSR